MQKEEIVADMVESTEAVRLTCSQRCWRIGISGSMLAGLWILKFVNPADGGLSLNTPLTQRVFGLPCPFCGITRGTHALLNGEVIQALYLNLATVAVLVTAVTLMMVWVVESVRGRALDWFMPAVNAVFCRWKLLAMALMLFWLFHLSVALFQSKTELLDEDAPLFPDFLLKATSQK